MNDFRSAGSGSQTYLVPGENPLDATTRTYAAIEVACLDLIGKTVGQRTVPNPRRIQPNEIEDSKAWRRSLGGVCGPKGVF